MRGDWFHALFGVAETNLKAELSVSQKSGSDAWSLVCQANRRTFNAGPTENRDGNCARVRGRLSVP